MDFIKIEIATAHLGVVFCVHFLASDHFKVLASSARKRLIVNRTSDVVVLTPRIACNVSTVGSKFLIAR